MPPVIKIETIDDNLKEVRLEAEDTEMSGNMYYTLDGSDPRLVGGNIHGEKYTGNINLENSTNIKARFYSSSDKSWSALAEKVVLFEKVFGEDVVINEIMYNPKKNFPEYIELKNNGNISINLKGFKFTDGIDYTFYKDKNMDPDMQVVLSNDSILYQMVYNSNVFGQYSKKLSNGGETIILKNGFNQIVDSVTYNDSIPWPEMADGYGYSLMLKDPLLDNSQASSWKISDFISSSRTNKKLSSELSVTMYPNPFSGDFKISLNSIPDYSERYIVKVYNSVGRLVKEEKWEHINSPKQIDLGQETPGFYIIKVSAQGSTQKEIVLKGIKLDY